MLENMHTMTYKKYIKLNKFKDKELDKVIKENLNTLNKIINFNLQNNIYFYRMSHNLFPLQSIKNINYNYSKYKNKCFKIGLKIKKKNIRLDSHPDHFLVLNSSKQDVLDTSIKIILNYKLIFDMLDINGKIILHIGSSNPSKKDAIKRFINNFLKLDKSLQKIILIENDDKTYTTTETLLLCEKLNIPMVFDYHHYKCNHDENENLNLLLPRIINTWKNTNLNPKMHFSSPKSKKEKRTHDYFINYKEFIKFLNLIKIFNTDIDIMLESKGKDLALFKLLKQLKFYNKYNVKKGEIIIN